MNKAKNPEWFKMHDIIAPAVEYLPDEIAGQGFKASMRYYTKGEEADLSTLNPAAIGIYCMVKRWIDEAAIDLERKSEAGREAAKRQWDKYRAEGTHGTAKGTHAETEEEPEEEPEEEKEPETEGEKDHHHPQTPVKGGAGGGADPVSKLIGEFPQVEPEAVRFAYEDVAEGAENRFRYVKAILSRWSKAGIKTVEQARADSNRDKFERSKPDYSFDENNPYVDESPASPREPINGETIV